MAVDSSILLTLGSVLFNWKPEVWRDFYFRMADEALLDTVYLGEVVCSKRLPLFAPHMDEVARRLSSAGKEVVFPSLALVMSERERQIVKELCERPGITVEANDMTAVSLLEGRPHTVGPFVSVYNEDTLAFLHRKGASVFCLPFELPIERIAALSLKARELGAQTEVQVYGKIPLAVSSRCYHARAHGLSRDNCRFVCGEDPDGMDLDTLEDQPFMTVNGVQTMSRSCLNLAAHLESLKKAGVSRFRLSPQSCDMVETISLFKNLLDEKIDILEAMEKLRSCSIDASFSDGFLCGKCGHLMTGTGT